MRFDSNQAWNEAVAVVRRNRDLLVAIAGVFFLLPTLLSTVFLADVQEQMMAVAQDPEALEALVEGHMAQILGFGLGGALVQYLGYLACAVILGGAGRPSVGEALAGALRALPTLLGATIVYILGLLLASFVLSLFVALGSMVGAASLGGTIMVIALAVLALYTSVRFSLLIPAIVCDGCTNPVLALKRSWRLTQGNAGRLLGFYALIMVGYLAISFLVSLIVVSPVTLLVGQGHVATFVAGLVAGLVGSAASGILIAVLVRIHGQLAGPGSEPQGAIFD